MAFQEKQRLRARGPAGRLVDEQFWPVAAAIAALGVVLVSLATAYLRTDDPRWYANSWNWFGLIVVACCLVLSLLRLQMRRLRPGIQLSVILCALIHILLLVAALETSIFDRWWEEKSLAQVEEPPILLSPDYQTDRVNSSQSQLEQLEQPIQVETPNPPQPSLRQETVDVPIEVDSPQVESEEAEVVPNQAARREATSAPPRPGDEQHQYRRADAKIETVLPTDVVVPPAAEPPPREAITARLSTAARRQPQITELSRAAAAAPNSEPVVSPQRTALAAREDQPDVQELGAANSFSKRFNSPAPLPIETNVVTGQATNEMSRAPAAALTVEVDGPAKNLLQPTVRRALPPDVLPANAAPTPNPTLRSAPRRRSSLAATVPTGGPSSTGPARRRSLPGQLRVETQIPLSTDTSAAGAGDNVRGNRDGVSAADGDLAESTATAPAKQTTALNRRAVADGQDQTPPAIALNPGIRSRRTTPESESALPQTSRFRRRDFSAARPTNQSMIVVPTQPFRQRASRLADVTPAGGNLGPETEAAIERGLKYLVKQQSADGRWRLSSPNEPAALSSDTAATGLALLAFQGAGYNHLEHKYASVVKRGIQFLTEHQQRNGDLFLPLDDDSNRSVWLYSHGIACLALTEAYGMTQDPDLRGPAQRSLDFIVSAQDQTNGGWRYVPGVSSDSSVSGWMLMALKSGELADLQVPDRCWSLARRWFDLAQSSETDPHLYRYNPFAPDTPSQRHGRVASETMTAVGLLMRLYDGWHREDSAMVRGGDYLLGYLPALGSPGDPKRDTYFWYYGTQVMFHMQGEYWDAWRNALQPLLIDRQVMQGNLAGSWEPRGAIPDRWASHAGRLYVTTLNLLSLEVRYRHLPIYEETAR